MYVPQLGKMMPYVFYEGTKTDQFYVVA